jgi:hypothetical protein
MTGVLFSSLKIVNKIIDGDGMPIFAAHASVQCKIDCVRVRPQRSWRRVPVLSVSFRAGIDVMSTDVV